MDESTMIGVVPAAGWGTRMAGAAMSKELLPAWKPPGSSGVELPLPACRCCLEAMSGAGITSVLVPIRAEKWDLARYLESQVESGLRVALVLPGATDGPVGSVAAALRFARTSTIALGLPDILFRASDPFGRLRASLEETGADAVLGLFPHPPGRTADAVRLTAAGAIERIVPASHTTGQGLSWALAVWRPTLTEHLLAYAARFELVEGPEREARLGLGAAFQAALDDGLAVHGVQLSDRSFLDIGEPAGWLKAVRDAAREPTA